MILRRFPFVSGVLIGFLIAIFVFGNLDVWLKAADAQVPFGAFRIMDGTHTQLARVNHTGQLAVDATVATDNVNVFHQSTIAHVSSVVHMAAADGGFVIRDPLNAGARARVDHTGALVTSATVTVTTDNVNVFHQSTIRHVSSETHVAGALMIRDKLCISCVARIDHTGALVTTATVTVTTDNVNVFHQSTIRHVSGSLHIGGTIEGARFHIQGLGLPGASHGGVLTIQGITGMNAVVVSQATASSLQMTATQTGTWTVQPGNTVNTSAWLVQVAHVSAVTHIASAGLALANQALAVRCVDTGGTTFQACGGGADPQSVVQSSSWTIQAAHLVVISHIAQSVHIGGTIQGAQFHVQGLGLPGASHGGVLTIQGITGMNAVVVSQATASSLQMTATQTGTWTVQPGNTPNTTAWLMNVGHISSVLHIQVAGAGIPGASLSVRCVNTGGTAFADCGGAGAAADAVNVFHQSTIRHISSVTHVTIVGSSHLTGALHVTGISNVGSGAPGTGTTQMVCHSTLAIHVAATAPGYTQIIHLTSSNGGINQAQWRIYICSIMVVSAHAQGFSLLEGTGTTCMGQPRHALIGAWRPDDSVVLAANGGFSLAAPFPFASTQVPGNNLCIGQTTRTSGGSISGVMSYRAGP